MHVPVTARRSTVTPPKSTEWSRTFAPSSILMGRSSASSDGASTTQDPNTTSSPMSSKSYSTLSKKSTFTLFPIRAPSRRYFQLNNSVLT